MQTVPTPPAHVDAVSRTASLARSTMIEAEPSSSKSEEEQRNVTSRSRAPTMSVAQGSLTPDQKVAKRLWKGLTSDLKEPKCKDNDRDRHEAYQT
ncbi:unnamed protein product [Gordionus sp. m RMFG-2023]